MIPGISFDPFQPGKLNIESGRVINPDAVSNILDAISPTEGETIFGGTSAHRENNSSDCSNKLSQYSSHFLNKYTQTQTKKVNLG